VVAGIVILITWQVNDLTSDLGNVQQKAKGMLEQVKDYFSRTFGIAKGEQQKIIEEQSKNTNGAIAGIGGAIFGFVVDFILMLVYTFLILHARNHLKKFILRLIPSQGTANAEDAMANIQKVTQQYLTGLSLMIVSLWVLYSIGFSIVGLKNPFFFAILCGLLETIPFVGNLTGNGLAILMAITQGGGADMIIGILITYGIIQFFQTYLLEPLVVGAEVNINPLFTILALVVGELLWGIPGMVLAIPLLAIVKIICDHVEPLKPYGFLIGSEKKKKKRFWRRD
jgi:predicted PurR-regulated permease PerM